MPSTGFIKPISVAGTSTSGNEEALLNSSGDATLTGNSTITATYPAFDIPTNATITGITIKTRVTPISITTTSVFQVRINFIDSTFGSNLLTLFDDSTSVQQVFSNLNLGGNTILDQAINIDHTYNSNNSVINTVNPANDFAQQLISALSTLSVSFDLFDQTPNTADVIQINCDTESPAISIEYLLPPPTKVKIKSKDLNALTDSGLYNPPLNQFGRGAATLVNSSGVTSPTSLLNGVGSNSSFSPDGFVVLSDFFTSNNPLGEFTIPENALNIQLRVVITGFNANVGDVRLKYSFTSPGSEAITIVSDIGIPASNMVRTHNNVFTHSGFTPSFWNNFTQMMIELNDDYPFSTNYLFLGTIDLFDPSLVLEFDTPPSVKVKIPSAKVKIK